MGTKTGETVRIADNYTRGLINDHVQVQPHSDIFKETYTVYARSKYHTRGGPRPLSKDSRQILEHEFLNLGEKHRGWGEIEVICQDVPLERAVEIATAEAQRRGFVLYLRQTRAVQTAIHWHPNGWNPIFG